MALRSSGRLLLAFVAGGFMGILFPFGVSGTQQVRVRVQETPPQYFQSSDGEWVGAEIECLLAVLDAAALEVEYRAMDWSDALVALEGGDLDVVMAMSRTPEREDMFRFLGPSRAELTVLLVPEDLRSTKIETLDDLKNLPGPVGIRRDYFYSESFREKRRRDPEFAARLRVLEPGEDEVSLLRSRQVSAVLEEIATASYRIATSSEYGGLSIHPARLFEERPVYFGVSRHLSGSLFDRLQEKLEVLERRGALREIRDRWRGLELKRTLNELARSSE